MYVISYGKKLASGLPIFQVYEREFADECVAKHGCQWLKFIPTKTFFPEPTVPLLFLEDTFEHAYLAVNQIRRMAIEHTLYRYSFFLKVLPPYWSGNVWCERIKVHSGQGDSEIYINYKHAEGVTDETNLPETVFVNWLGHGDKHVYTLSLDSENYTDIPVTPNTGTLINWLDERVAKTYKHDVGWWSL